MTSDQTIICNRGEFILTAIFVSTTCMGIRSNVWRSVNCHSIQQPAAILPYSVGSLPVYKLWSYFYCNKCYFCLNSVFTVAAVYAATPDPYSKTHSTRPICPILPRDTSVSVFGAWAGIMGELSYLAPLGSENISAPYFKQCFFQGGGITPQTNTTPPSPKTEITNILFYILNFGSIIKFKM